MTSSRIPSSLAPPAPGRGGRWLAAAAGTAAVLGACALVVRRQTRKAEQASPPAGRFITVQGVRLHFTVHGRDDAEQTVVLLHGNGALGQDFDISGVVAQASERYRVVVFDRPGHGHSERPAKRLFGPEEQADLLHAAFTRLGIASPVVLGHSFGAQVALAMGLRHPSDLGALVLLSGYYYPSLRLDVPLQSSLLLPGIGWLMRHTVSPLMGRLLWPLVSRRIFWPKRPTAAFRKDFPVWMSLRPSQLRASAADAATMIPAARAMRDRYARLDVPAVLAAGARDAFLSTRWHSTRLHEQAPRSWLRVIEDTGHMPHHVAPGQVMAAIHQAAAMVWDPSLRWRPASGLKEDEPQGAPAIVPCG